MRVFLDTRRIDQRTGKSFHNSALTLNGRRNENIYLGLEVLVEDDLRQKVTRKTIALQLLVGPDIPTTMATRLARPVLSCAHCIAGYPA